jgi:hypothetical protein
LSLAPFGMIELSPVVQSSASTLEGSVDDDRDPFPQMIGLEKPKALSKSSRVALPKVATLIKTSAASFPNRSLANLASFDVRKVA